MFGLGMPELILILIIALVVFGPSKLPEMGASVGKAIREFRNAAKEPEPDHRPAAPEYHEAPKQLAATDPVGEKDAGATKATAKPETKE